MNLPPVAPDSPPSAFALLNAARERVDFASYDMHNARRALENATRGHKCAAVVEALCFLYVDAIKTYEAACALYDAAKEPK